MDLDDIIKTVFILIAIFGSGMVDLFKRKRKREKQQELKRQSRLSGDEISAPSTEAKLKPKPVNIFERIQTALEDAQQQMQEQQRQQLSSKPDQSSLDSPISTAKAKVAAKGSYDQQLRRRREKAKSQKRERELKRSARRAVTQDESWKQRDAQGRVPEKARPAPPAEIDRTLKTTAEFSASDGIDRTIKSTAERNALLGSLDRTLKKQVFTSNLKTKPVQKRVRKITGDQEEAFGFLGRTGASPLIQAIILKEILDKPLALRE